MKNYDVGKDVKVSCFKYKTSSLYNNLKHNLYKICINVGGKKMFFKYHDSVYNYARGGYPNTNDIVKKLIEDAWDYDDNRNVKTFANRFGYKLDKETHLDFRDCEKAYYKLKTMLSNKEIEKLYQLVK